jgi:hypothetical protein
MVASRRTRTSIENARLERFIEEPRLGGAGFFAFGNPSLSSLTPPNRVPIRRENLEKQIATIAYWIGIVSTALAIIMRGLAVLGIFTMPYTAIAGGKVPISYHTFLDGAILFFVMAIASAVIAWAKERKA